MSISQMMIAGSSNSRPPKVVDGWGITYEPVYEGQQQTISLHFSNWDNSAVYWTLVEAGSSASLNSRVVGGQANGTIYPGNGDSSQTINFTFSADATTEGTTYYVVRVGSTPGGNDYINNGNYTLRDSSQTPALVLDLDTASDVTNNVWVDSSGQQHNGSIYFLDSYSTDNGGTYLWNGSSTQAEVTSLNNSTYGTVTLSAWIKPTAVTGSNQTIIAKELCYKLRINGDGTTTMSTGKGNAGWEVTATADAGAVTAGAWAHLVATSDTDYTRIYVNGVKVSETSGNIIGANSNPFDIGMYQTTGSPSDFFGGRMGKVKVWNYALTEASVRGEYNSTAARYGKTPIPLSLNFVGSGDTYLLVSNTQSDWNLGSTYTIEFWSKSANASSNTIRTISSQGPGNGIDIGYAYEHLLFRNSEPIYAEPTSGAWTHVAYVSTGTGITNLYYNGIYQTNFATGGGLVDGSTDLTIGRRGPGNAFQYFYGKLAMIRISSTAKYLTDFTPSNSYGVESDTKLMLGSDPTIDATTVHPINVHNVDVSTDFPS